MNHNKLFQPIKLILTLAILLITIFALVGCGGDNRQTNTNTPPTPIKIQFSWVHEYILTPFYAAEQNNHFIEQNLDAQLMEGGFKDGVFINAIEQVTDGAADFGTTNAYSLILARVEGLPLRYFFSEAPMQSSLCKKPISSAPRTWLENGWPLIPAALPGFTTPCLPRKVLILLKSIPCRVRFPELTP